MELVFTFVVVLAQVLSFAVLARALMSWFPVSPYNPLVSFVNQITEPVLAPLRRVIPRLGMIDVSPMVAIVILQIIAWAAGRQT